MNSNFLKSSKRIIILLAVIIASVPNANAQKKKKQQLEDAGNTITLVTSGNGENKDDAVKNALRNALEQTYGAFVSANSEVVNDELVKDEIVSISTGNVVSYDVLSYKEDTKEATVKSVVSITRLSNYARNKGMAAELAGNTFAMNLKIEELNAKNLNTALEHLLSQTKIYVSDLFDYELVVGEPEKNSMGSSNNVGIYVPLSIIIKANANTVSYYELFHNTLSSLTEVKKTGSIHELTSYRANYEIYEIDITMEKSQMKRENLFVGYGFKRNNSNSPIAILERINQTLLHAILNCEIVDNIGNISGFENPGNDDRGLKHPSNLYPYNFKFIDGRKLYFTNKLFGNGNFTEFLRNCRINRLAGRTPHWLVATPQIGEKLYEAKLYLKYTVDEISKVSKIEIRPKVFTPNSPSTKVDAKGINEST